MNSVMYITVLYTPGEAQASPEEDVAQINLDSHGDTPPYATSSTFRGDNAAILRREDNVGKSEERDTFLLNVTGQSSAQMSSDPLFKLFDDQHQQAHAQVRLRLFVKFLCYCWGFHQSENKVSIYYDKC